MANKKLFYGVFGVAIIIAAGVFLFLFIKSTLRNSPTQNSNQNTNQKEEEISYHEVKYYFDNIETFEENDPQAKISSVVNIRGKLIQRETQPACLVAPCNPVVDMYLQDVNEENYKIFLYKNAVVENLAVNKIYILKGSLEKELKEKPPTSFAQCNKDLCKFEISLLRPLEVIQSEN